MKTKITILFFFIITQFAFGQKRGILTGPKVDTSCQCSKLVVRPYFYYQDPDLRNNSNLYLRFDFQHKGMRCKPDFVGSITIYRADDIKVTIPLNTLTSYVDTENQRIFVITPLSLPNSFRPMTVGGNYKITYSLRYGTTSVCPATSSQIIRFQTSEPIL